MSRPKKIRFLSGDPAVSGFTPFGKNVKEGLPEVFLLYEEYEALRLCDYEGFNQMQAATVMHVSRPTFTRIYISARGKIATAFVEGRRIKVEGGKVRYNDGWYFCKRCGCRFDSENKDPQACPLCGSKDFSRYDPEEEVRKSAGLETDGVAGYGRRCRRGLGGCHGFNHVKGIDNGN